MASLGISEGFVNGFIHEQSYFKGVDNKPDFKKLDNYIEDYFDNIGYLCEYLRYHFKSSFKPIKQSDNSYFTARQLHDGGCPVILINVDDCAFEIIADSLSILILPIAGGVCSDSAADNTETPSEEESCGIFAVRGRTCRMDLSKGCYLLVGIKWGNITRYRSVPEIADLSHSGSRLSIRTNYRGIALSHLILKQLAVAAPFRSVPAVYAAFELSHLIDRLIAIFWHASAARDMCGSKNRGIVGKDLERVCQLILKDLGHTPSLPELAQKTGLSIRTIQDLFRREMGCTPKQWVIQQKLAAVRRKLECANESDSVTGIAVEYFTNLGDFSRRYRSFYGELPSETLKLSRKRIY